MTLKTVYSSFKEYGYKYESLYAYKAFPEEDEWFDLIYSAAISAGNKDGIYIEYDPYRDKER